MAIAQSQQVPAPPLQENATRAAPTRDFQQMIEAQKLRMQSSITTAVERVQHACREELHNFCSTVTPGQGRLLLCMQAHEDKLGNQCELALLDASRNIRQAIHHFEHVADACGSDIQAYCAEGSSIAQCMSEKRALLSPRCQAVVTELQPPSREGSQQQPTLAGLPIYSSDGMKVGEVIRVKTGLDGRPQMIQAEIGSLLGLGTSMVLISPDEFESRVDGIQLRIPAEQVRAVLQGSPG
jgi:Golgi apparatus protein 1